MFQRVNIPPLGMVENMAYMINPVNGEKMQLFPKGEIDSYAASKNIAKLGEIPFNPSVGMACEAGIPIVEANTSGAEAQEFLKIADRLREILPV
ncbi:antiporter inner membrane protein [compost metagenome]